MDIDVSATKGTQLAQISSIVPVVAGQVIALTDLRFKIATSGPVSFNNTFASAILKQLTAQTSYSPAPSSGNLGYYAGLPFTENASVSTGSMIVAAAPIVATAYDGPIPESANAQATGTKLWEKSYSSTAGSNIWGVSGNTMTMEHTFTANAIADGTPTYIRIVKNELITIASGSAYAANYPRFEVQIPVGDGAGFANFTMTNFVAGQSATLNTFTISFLLPELV
jgi:hypothetical protein